MEIAQQSNRGQEQARRATSLEGEEAAHRSLELHVDYGVQGLVGRCAALQVAPLGGGRPHPSPSRFEVTTDR